MRHLKPLNAKAAQTDSAAREGRLQEVVAMQTVEPSAPQLRLTQQIAAITV